MSTRFLLLISKSSISPYLVSYVLNSLNKNYIFLVSSNLKNDIKGEEKGGRYSESFIIKFNSKTYYSIIDYLLKLRFSVEANIFKNKEINIILIKIMLIIIC